MIHTTPEHPFYVQAKGWTPAGELAVGDLLSTADGRWLPLEATVDTGRLETVYNMRVADYHTYFVGSGEWGFSVWVHNRYTGFNSLTLAQKLEYMEEAGISGAQGLADRVRAGALGARFQAQRAVAYYRSGWLQSIEHAVENGRVDLLLRNAMQVETKAWRVWAELGQTIQGKRLDVLENQVQKYLAAGDRLRLEFKGSIFGEVEELLEGLRGDYGNRLSWKVI